MDVELISRAAAMEAFMDKPPGYYHTCYIVGELNCVPAVDAVPVVHGRWVRYSEIFHDPECTLVKCSACGGESCCEANYCPDCGAKMDKEE